MTKIDRQGMDEAQRSSKGKSSSSKASRRRGGVPLARGVWPLGMPALIITALLIVAPIVSTVVLAFSVSRGESGMSFNNFERMSQDPIFWQSLRVTLLIFFVCLVLQMVLGVGLGYLLSIDVPGRGLMQSLVLLPAIIASVAIGLLWLLIYDPTLGVANKILELLGAGGVVWLGDPRIAPWALIIVETWQWVPFVALITSAGIRSLPEDVFEAADIDGAGGIKKAWYVGLPLLAPVIMVAALLRTVDLIRFFDLAYIMTQGGPVNSTNSMNLYGYRQAFIYQDRGYAATLQVTLFVFVLLVATGFTLARRRFTVDY